jgi:hypothetical protein
VIRRWTLRLAGLLVGLFALYLVAMNVFLRTRLFRNLISNSPEDVLIDYTSAYSLFPGRIHAEGLRIRGSDSMVQWILVLDHCDFRVWPLDLLKRNFHASHVRGDGLSFRLRLKLVDADATPKLVAALPPVPGFSDPPYRLIGPPRAPLTDADYNLVSIQLDDVVADHVREIWTQSLRLAGDMRVEGRWLFRPVRWLDVGPATVDVAALDVSYGPDRPLATSLHGKVDLTIHPFDVRVPEGLEILEQFSASSQLKGTLNAANAFDAIADVPATKFVRGEGPFEVAAVLGHGKVLPGSRIEAYLTDGEVDSANAELAFAAGVEVLVEAGANGPRARANLGLSNPRVTKDGVELVRASSVSATLVSSNVDLAHPSDEATTFSLDARGIRAPSVAPVRPFLLTRYDVDVHSGAVTGDAHLDGRLEDARASGELGFGVKALTVARKSDKLVANAQGRIELDAFSLRGESTVLSGSQISFDDVSAKVHGVDVKAPRLEVRLPRAILRERNPDVELRMDLPRLDCADLRQLNALLPRDVPSSPLQIEKGRARASARIDLDLDSLTIAGNAEASTEGLRFRAGTESFASNLGARIVARRDKARPEITDLSGSAVHFETGAESGAEPWWARIVAPAASLRLAAGAGLSARVAIEAKDASPAEALVAKLTGVPRWLVEAAPMSQLQAHGEIRAAPSTFEVRSLEAHGGTASLSLEYARHGDDKQGAALVHIGILGLGFKLAGDGPSLVLVGAKSWFDRKVRAIRGDPRYSWQDEGPRADVARAVGVAVGE